MLISKTLLFLSTCTYIISLGLNAAMNDHSLNNAQIQIQIHKSGLLVKATTTIISGQNKDKTKLHVARSRSNISSVQNSFVFAIKELDWKSRTSFISQGINF